jgi:CubicO group peptidase (beta-lactamase class C family)
MLIAIAIDKALVDVTLPVGAYLGSGWSKTTPEQESMIRVINLLNMNSGLSESFTFVAPPGTVFFYNTPAYALTKQILAKAAKQSLDAITHDWLAGPAGMDETSWRERPSIPAFAGADNRTGLVTSPRDVAKFGQIVLDGGRAADGRRLVSGSGLEAMFARSPTNPACGRLWWLNGVAFSVRAGGARHEGPLVAAAPADLAAALGALERRLYVVPSQKLLVVRLGAGAPDHDFDQQLWLRLKAALG